MDQKSIFARSLFVKIILVIFVVLSAWWFSIYYRGLKEGIENNYFTLIYPFVSLFGGIAGLVYSKKWGGLKSMLGRAITFFSLGLLFQFLGQAAYAYYIYIQGVQVPYPSIGDIGYFGSVLLYIIGSIHLANVSGLKYSLRSIRGKIFVFLLPLFMLIFSYMFFLKGYQFDPVSKLKIFLDFGYPFGQAIYVSVAILALVLCKSVLGGVMKKPLTFMLIALVFQYFSDFMFLYQANAGTWYVGGVNDYMYLVSYFLMTVSLVYVGGMFNHINENNN